MNEPIDVESIPPTPNVNQPNRQGADVIFTTMIMHMQTQIGELQGDVRRLQSQNTRLEESLAQSNRNVETLTGELRAEKGQVLALKQRLAVSEEANLLAQERLQQVRAEMEKTAVNIQQRQEETTATLRRVDEHVGVVEAKAVDACNVASRAEESAVQIATKSTEFFARVDRNEVRLNRLQQTLSSADTLQVGTKKVSLYPHSEMREVCRSLGVPVDREEPDYLPENVQVGLKELGKSLTP